MSIPPFQLPPAFEQRLVSVLGETSPSALANQVLKLSDHFTQKVGERTPWRETFAREAYLAYFLPLNFVRLTAALREVERFLDWNCVSEVWDIGSGTGATHFALEDATNLPAKSFFNVEVAPEAIEIHKRLIEAGPKPRFKPEYRDQIEPSPSALGIFSYAFVETRTPLELLSKFEHLLIVEPSVREVGRTLMELRAKLIAEGWSPLAPCTHAEGCPLLLHSQKDWCHMRVHYSAPQWWDEMEAHLPMKNRTLTYSYLLVSRTQKDSKWRGEVRVIGDTLPEKGKTRQLMCRGSQREFLSWLHKQGEPPYIPHGALIAGLNNVETKGAEVRPPPGPLAYDI